MNYAVIFLQKINALLEKRLNKAQSFIFLSIIFLIAIYPILRANVLYVDDLGRSFAGYNNWSIFGRYINDIISVLLHGNIFIGDISPIPQLISISVLALACLFMIYCISGKNDFSIISLIASIPIAISPYFIECLSYRYDSLYMSISVLIAIAPIILLHPKNKTESSIDVSSLGNASKIAPQPNRSASKIIPGSLYVAKSICHNKFMISIFCSVLAICLTYQVSLGILFSFFIIIILNYLLNNANNLDLFKLILQFLAATVIALLIFRLALFPDEYTGYVDTRMAPIFSLPVMIYKNLKTYYAFFIKDFNYIWLILCTLILLSFIYVIMKKAHTLAMKVGSLVIICILICSCFGAYPLLVKPLFVPRAMYGITALVGIMCVYIVCHSNDFINKLIIFALCWSFFIFAPIYGNCLKAQQDYTDFRIELVLSEINDLPHEIIKDIKNITIYDTASFAPSLKHVMWNYPILKRLCVNHFVYDWLWGKYKFYFYYGLENFYHEDSERPDKNVNYPILLKDSFYNMIKMNSTNIAVYLKNRS